MFGQTLLLPLIIMIAKMQRSSTVFSQACRLSEK